MNHDIYTAPTSIYSLLFLLIGAALANADEELDIPVPADKSETYEFRILSDSTGYINEQGHRVIDVLQGYHEYLALSVDTDEGKPVMGLKPRLTMNGTSQIIYPGEHGTLSSTDESGIVEFGVVAGMKGMDELTVSFGENKATVYFNIISLSINNFPSAPTLDYGLSWSELMQASLEFKNGELEVFFPDLIKQQNGETVHVAGFMMPLDPGLKQKHFLLTSSPPHCFFHIPGGPSGVIEVFSDQGVEASWEPIILQGRLELVDGSETGVIYKLQEAAVHEPE